MVETLCGWPKYLPWVFLSARLELVMRDGVNDTNYSQIGSIFLTALGGIPPHIEKSISPRCPLNQIFFFVFRRYTPVRYTASKMLLPVQRLLAAVCSLLTQTRCRMVQR